jgi:hypothetical protein
VNFYGGLLGFHLRRSSGRATKAGFRFENIQFKEEEMLESYQRWAPVLMGVGCLGGLRSF